MTENLILLPTYFYTFHCLLNTAIWTIQQLLSAADSQIKVWSFKLINPEITRQSLWLAAFCDTPTA